jgi:hypothetical protein
MALGAPEETLCPTRSRSVNSRACSERPRRAGRQAPATRPLPLGAWSTANVRDPPYSAAVCCAAGSIARAASQVLYKRKERGSWENVLWPVDERSSTVAASCAGGSGGAARASQYASFRHMRRQRSIGRRGLRAERVTTAWVSIEDTRRSRTPSMVHVRRLQAAAHATDLRS